MSSLFRISKARPGALKCFRSTSAAALTTLLLAGCSEDGGQFDIKSIFQPKEGQDEIVARASAVDEGLAGELIERDVEAPEVFEATEAGLWDGRPSLGGVWVAHPDVTDPERVLIRNASNDKFVVGALFRRERDIPGPRLQISSDAADALSMLAGAPTQLEVVALRKESVPVEVPLEEPFESDLIEEAPAIETASLDPLAGVEAALEVRPLDEATQTAAAAAPLPATPAPAAATPVAKPVPAAPNLSKPFLQIGIFSVEENANQTADIMRNAGIVPTTKKFERDGKSFWRVLVGPAQSSAERGELLAQIKKQGYTDAYAVSN